MEMRSPGDCPHRGETPHRGGTLTESTVSARLQAAVEARVAAGAPGTLARVELSGAGSTWVAGADTALVVLAR
jgi:hypothetical protein